MLSHRVPAGPWEATHSSLARRGWYRLLSASGGSGAKKIRMKKIAPRSLLYLSVLPCGMCGTQAKSCVTVRVARPRGWGTGIRSTDHDKVLRVRHGPSMHTVHNNTHATVHCFLACSDAGPRHTAPTTARASGPGKRKAMQAHTRARTRARARARAYTCTCTRTRARARHTHTHSASRLPARRK